MRAMTGEDGSCGAGVEGRGYVYGEGLNVAKVRKGRKWKRRANEY